MAPVPDAGAGAIFSAVAFCYAGRVAAGGVQFLTVLDSECDGEEVSLGRFPLVGMMFIGPCDVRFFPWNTVAAQYLPCLLVRPIGIGIVPEERINSF